MKYKKKYILIFVVIILLFLFFGRGIFIKDKIDEISTYQSYTKADLLLEDDYETYLLKYQELITYNELSYTVVPSSFDVLDSLRVDQDESNAYDVDVVKVQSGDEVTIHVNLPKEGMYYMNIDYYYAGHELTAPKIGVLVNGAYPFYESRQLSIPITWAPEVEDIEVDKYQTIHHYQIDRYDNEVQPKSKIIREWMNSNLFDSSYFYGSPFMFYLKEGNNEIKITARNSDLYIGKFTLKEPDKIPSYNEYYKENASSKRYNGLIALEAEYYTYKSDPSIKLYSDTNPSSSNYETKRKVLNAIDAYTWNEAGRSVTWKVNVPEDGLYKIGFKYIQYQLVDLPAFRKIEIDNKVPFQELSIYPFHYSTKWKNETLGNEIDDYYFYLTKGEHEIKLTSVVEPYRPIIKTIETIMKEITDLSLKIKKLTGGKVDTYRDWKITDYIPDISEQINIWADELNLAYRYGNSLNNTEKLAGELVNLRYSENNLRKLADNPDDIPNKLTVLSEGTTSVSQYLGDLMLRLTKQSMGLEKFYLYNNEKLPRADANIFLKLMESIKSFFLSFNQQGTKYDANDADTIEVWVNRPRANIDLMQKMIDEEFTPNTGIKVNISLMPNANKLILANASGIEPDIAMGVASKTPYEFAIRNAVVDLRGFDGYEEIVSNYPKGAMIPYVYDDGVYGLPETLDFHLTYYRTDILEKLDIPIPQTWDDVVSILPELQRFGMNYYAPLGSGSSYKGFPLTIPYYYQNDPKLYADDGMRTVIDSKEGIDTMKLMTDLFTVYDLPKQIPNFYNHIRYGTLPIGVGNSNTYLQLLIAAPEIRGNWEIELYPGIEGEDGVIKRYAPVSSLGVMMFKSSEKQDKSFEFIKWWLDTDTQKQYASDIQTMYGKEYMWFSANLDALNTLSIEESHKDKIIEQLSWAIEAPNVPGGYYLEREISNAWNRIVFDDRNIRSTVDEAVVSANREIKRKMTEFEYVIDNKKVKDFIVPTIDNIDYWLKERRDNE